MVYYSMSGEVVVVKMDKQGRILIPADIRRMIGTNLFHLEYVNGELRLKPIKPIKLTSLFDKIEASINDFTDTHKLRKSVYAPIVEHR